VGQHWSSVPTDSLCKVVERLQKVTAMDEESIKGYVDTLSQVFAAAISVAIYRSGALSRS
jgi:hypothetical protein